MCSTPASRTASSPMASTTRGDKRRGTQRFRGRAVDGHPFKVRCPNTSTSMRMPHTIPTTTCLKGEACGCGKTVTVKDTDHERNRQPLPWQGNPWAKSFNRRTLIEGFFGSARYQSGSSQLRV